MLRTLFGHHQFDQANRSPRIVIDVHVLNVDLAGPCINEEPSQFARMVGNGHIDRAAGALRPAVLARDCLRATDSSRKNLMELLRAVTFNGHHEGIEVLSEGSQRTQYRPCVETQDLFPQVRVARSHAGDIAHTLARQSKVIGGHLGQMPSHQYGDEVRHVRDGGHRSVMLRGRGHDGRGPARAS